MILVYHINVMRPVQYNSHTYGIYMTQFCKVKRKNASPNCELHFQLLRKLQRIFHRIIATMDCREFCERLIMRTRNLTVTH